MTTSTRVRVRKAKKDQKLEEGKNKCPYLDPPSTRYQLQSDSDQVLQPRGSKEEGEEDQDQSEGDEEEDDDDDEEQEQRKQRFLGYCGHVQQSQQHCGTLHGKRIGSHQGKPTRKRSHIVSSSTLASKQHAIECVTFKERMQVGVHQSSSKLSLKNTEGEIQDVPGGRIGRPNGRKDRHSKVCTSKGLRDRRIRLAAHTAIQFYDVQDQLGYDRPSKAIDWLMEKAKRAIDELAEVPNNATTSITSAQQTEQDPEEQSPNHLKHQQQYNGSGTITGSSSGYDIKNQQDLNDNPINSPSFFSMAADTPSSSIHFLHPPDLNSRTISRTQDLVLNRHYSSPMSVGEPVLFSASSALVFDPTRIGWSHLEMPEMGQLQRMIAWNSETGNGGEEFGFNSLPQSPRQLLLSENQLHSQREPLQSSNSPSTCAWNKLPIATNGYHQSPALNPLLASGVEFTSHGFSRFRIPARIQGEDEVQNAVSNKPSAACSASHF